MAEDNITAFPEGDTSRNTCLNYSGGGATISVASSMGPNERLVQAIYLTKYI